MKVILNFIYKVIIMDYIIPFILLTIGTIAFFAILYQLTGIINLSVLFNIISK